jgi:hypothetical protein
MRRGIIVVNGVEDCLEGTKEKDMVGARRSESCRREIDSKKTRLGDLRNKNRFRVSIPPFCVQ